MMMDGWMEVEEGEVGGQKKDGIEGEATAGLLHFYCVFHIAFLTLSLRLALKVGT